MYFLNINKPKGITSFDCIRKLRKKLNMKAIGHSGTLDPLASGVLQIAVGKATKLLDYLPSDKEYIADIKFGYNSNTDDDEGAKTYVCEPKFSKNDLTSVLNEFLGETLQTPPKFSAIKQNGKKLCDIARKNPSIDIDIPKRLIEIYSIDLIGFDNITAQIKVSCKKGTYIRSLVRDIGEKLGCGAYITDLVRIRAGNFYITNANSPDDENFNIIDPIEALNLEKFELNDIQYEKIMHGCEICEDRVFKNKIILLTKNNKLVSVANLSDNPNSRYSFIKPRKNFKED